MDKPHLKTLGIVTAVRLFNGYESQKPLTAALHIKVSFGAYFII